MPPEASGEDRPPEEQRRERQRYARSLAREHAVGSWYVLLDFATFLEQHVNDVWTALVDNTTPSAADARQRGAGDSWRHTRRRHPETSA